MARRLTATSFTFISGAAAQAGVPEKLKLMRPTLAVSGTRNVKKTDMVLNGATPKLEVDSET